MDFPRKAPSSKDTNPAEESLRDGDQSLRDGDQSLRDGDQSLRDGDQSLRDGKSRRAESRSQRVMAILLRSPRATLVGIILVILLAEFFEHLVIAVFGEQAHILYDTVLLILLVPLLAWLVLSLLKHTETEREQAALANDMQSELSQQLGSAPTWEALVQLIVEHGHRVAPSAQVTLFVLHPASQRMLPEAICRRDGQVMLKPVLAVNPDTLPLGSLSQLLLQNCSAATAAPTATASPAPATAAAPATAGAQVTSPDSPLPPHRYDLPVVRNNQQIGVIKLEYPLGSAPSPSEIRALKSAAPLTALALEGAQLQKLATEQAAASDAERQQIAQTLHDTLAQNISYLRLKLDQLTGENAIREIGVVLQELELMRASADEAYQQVRDTLDELNPALAEDLVTIVVRQARVISERAGFALRSDQSGEAYILPPSTRQQILFIAREALHNIEKHARAGQVLLQFLWMEAEFILKITDDGAGFDPLKVPTEGHYGLWIMHQRAEEIGGTLKISPAEEHGTEVTLWVPRAAAARLSHSEEAAE